MKNLVIMIRRSAAVGYTIFVMNVDAWTVFMKVVVAFTEKCLVGRRKDLSKKDYEACYACSTKFDLFTLL